MRPEKDRLSCWTMRCLITHRMFPKWRARLLSGLKHTRTGYKFVVNRELGKEIMQATQ